MHTIEPSARDLRPHERLQELAAILAGGILRLRTMRFHLCCPHPSSPTPQAFPEQISCEKALELTPEKRRHVLTG